MNNESLALPLSAENFEKVSQGFGVANGSYVSKTHMGTDFAVPVGTLAYAIADGYVSDVYRNHVTLGNACFYTFMFKGVWYTARYLHLSYVPIEGQTFNKGDLLCHSGKTGQVTGPNLHLDIQKNAEHFSVLRILNRKDVLLNMEDPYTFIKNNLG